MNTIQQIEVNKHKFLKSFLLHILPGLITTIVFLLLKPWTDFLRYPPLLAFLIAVLIIDVPFMIGVMLYEGRKVNQRLSLKGVVLYQEKINWKTFAFIFVVVFIGVFIFITLVTPLNNMISETLFAGLPDWMFLEEQTQYEAYPKNVLVIVFVFQLILTGVVLPWVEELYFRGFLLPRLSGYAQWTPLVGGLLFGLYHSWQLYGFLTVFVLGAALGYIVWWKRDLRLSISLHIFANTLSRLAFLMAAIAM